MKVKQYIFIIIIISILVLILMQLSSNMELFVVNNRDFDYRQINRISNGNHNYSYCIGGNITCKKTPLNSTPIELVNNNQNFPDDFYNGGKTYKTYCMTNGVEDISNEVYCDGSIFSKLNQSYMPNYTLPKSNFTFPISTQYLGMTSPYSYVPAKLDSSDRNKLNFIRNQSGEVVEYMDICDVYYQTDQDNCKKTLYGSVNYPTIVGDAVNTTYDPNDIYTIQSSSSSVSSTSSVPSIQSSSSSVSSTSSVPSIQSSVFNSTPTLLSTNITSPIITATSSSRSSPKEKIYPPTDCEAKIKCKADFGTNIGDSLCCDQLGTLKNTDYVCPSVKPKCVNFDCKTQFGYCQ